MKKKISDKMYWALAFAGIEPIKATSKGKKKKPNSEQNQRASVATESASSTPADPLITNPPLVRGGTKGRLNPER